MKRKTRVFVLCKIFPQNWANTNMHLVYFKCHVQIMRKSIFMEVKRQMVEKNLTQVDIAKMMGTTQPQVSNWLSAKRFPNSTNLIKLSQLLDMQPDELLSSLQEIKELNS